MFGYHFVSIVLYLLIYWVTKKHSIKVKNLLNVLGIVWANIALYISIGEDGFMWLIHLTIAIFFCVMLDRTSNEVLQYNIESGAQFVSKEPSKRVASLLAIFLGIVGAHNFYLNKKTKGALYLMFSFFTIPAYIGVVEGIIYLTMSDEQFKNKYIVRRLVRERKENVIIKSAEKNTAVRKESYKKVENVKEKVDTSLKNADISKGIQESAQNQNKKINVPIGTAEIDKVGKEMKIKITDTNGKVYEFETAGNMQLFATFKAFGMQASKEYGGK